MEESLWMDIVLDTEAIFRKSPHIIVGIIVALFWLWLAERPGINKFLNPHRAELESIFAKGSEATAPEAEIAKGAMQFGAIVRVGMAIFLAILICWA